MIPFEFHSELWCQKTRVPALSCGVICVILRLAVLKQYRSVTDTHTHTHTQTDRQTDRRRRHIPCLARRRAVKNGIRNNGIRIPHERIRILVLPSNIRVPGGRAAAVLTFGVAGVRLFVSAVSTIILAVAEPLRRHAVVLTCVSALDMARWARQRIYRCTSLHGLQQLQWRYRDLMQD